MTFDNAKHVRGMIGRMKPDGCLRLDPLPDGWVQFGLWVPSYDAPAERLEMHASDAGPVRDVIADMIGTGALREAVAGREWAACSHAIP